MEEENLVTFEKVIGPKGQTLGVSIPEELRKWLEIEQGTVVKLAGLNGKYGKYLAVWRKDQNREL